MALYNVSLGYYILGGPITCKLSVIASHCGVVWCDWPIGSVIAPDCQMHYGVMANIWVCHLVRYVILLYLFGLFHARRFNYI